MYIVHTQPGGEGGQPIVINFITVQGGGGVKKGLKMRTMYKAPKGKVIAFVFLVITTKQPEFLPSCI